MHENRTCSPVRLESVLSSPELSSSSFCQLVAAKYLEKNHISSPQKESRYIFRVHQPAGPLGIKLVPDHNGNSHFHFRVPCLHFVICTSTNPLTLTTITTIISTKRQHRSCSCNISKSSGQTGPCHCSFLLLFLLNIHHYYRKKQRRHQRKQQTDGNASSRRVCTCND